MPSTCTARAGPWLAHASKNLLMQCPRVSQTHTNSIPTRKQIIRGKSLARLTLYSKSRLKVAVKVAVLADVPVSVNVCVRRSFKSVDTLFYRWRRGSSAGRAPLVVVGSRTTVALRRVERSGATLRCCLPMCNSQDSPCSLTRPRRIRRLQSLRPCSPSSLVTPCSLASPLLLDVFHFSSSSARLAPAKYSLPFPSRPKKRLTALQKHAAAGSFPASREPLSSLLVSTPYAPPLTVATLNEYNSVCQ